MLQTFVTVQAMPYREGKAKMQCMVKKEVSKKHSCCTILSKKDKKSKKKNCCSGTSKMSCCVIIIAISPITYYYKFINSEISSSVFGYQESISNYQNKIFHPPIIA